MAIDRMKKVTLVCQVTAAQRLLKTLHRLGTVELTDTFEQYEGAKEQLERQQVSTEECDRHLQKVNLLLNLLDQVAPVQQGFIAGLAPTPLVVEPHELDETVQHFDLDTHYGVAQELDAELRHAERTIGDIQNQIKELTPFEDLPFSIADLMRPERVRLLYGALLGRSLEAMKRDPDALKYLTWETVTSGRYLRKNGSGGAPPPSGGGKERIRLVVAYLKDHEDEARKVLTKFGFDEVTLPQLPGLVRDHIRELNADLAAEQERVLSIRSEAQKLSVHRRPLAVLKVFWENRKVLALARSSSAHGKWVQVLTGYIREKDVPVLEEAVEREFGTVSLLVDDPAPGENVPVSISLPPLLRPIQMLINLFGLPAYESFDPSPIIIFPFLLFFGICFSDVAYGVMLILGAVYIMSKTRAFAGIYNFAKLLLYAGISTVIFGFALGSWFGDLYKPEYLGENNIMYRIMTSVRLIDPLEKPIHVLLIALTIGMCNQFLGIILKMYGAIRRGNKAEAICDGLFWLIICPGFVIIVSRMFAPTPAPVFTAGLALFAVGAIGLILTQGRSAPTILGKISTGVISLYGIVGSYGLTAFIGDTMSYCRLLALALTTGIVALSFNMMANLLRPIPYAGPVLFVLILIIAHVFNFLISVLGAFVHSMRLIFVEMFGRFYKAGARPFSPLGFDSREAILKKE